ncbi:MAG: CHAT domain-containing protein [Streptosporangiales bacterium]|nr:CHAT domain-containing protein [Streptosporangiales bacterium]
MLGAEAALAAVELASADPALARTRAVALLGDGVDVDVETRCIAGRALALAAKELGDLSTAYARLREAIALAAGAGLARRAAEARLSLVAVLADQGRTAAALAEADAARASGALDAGDLGRLLAQRAMALARDGRLHRALAAFDEALPVLRDSGDARFIAGALSNRGLLLVHLGSSDAAMADLSESAAVAEAAGLPLIAAMARHNLGCAALRAGDLPRALTMFDAAEPAFTGSGERACCLAVDRAEALLAAGLTAQARDLLAGTVRRLGTFTADLADARLLLARARLVTGEAAEAIRDARAARAVYRGRTGWALLAAFTELEAHIAATGGPGHRPWAEAQDMAGRGGAGAGVDDEGRLAARVRRCRRRLAQRGWVEAAARARILSGRLALAAGRVEQARAELRAVAGARRDGPVQMRVAAWYAEALLRLADGRRAAAIAAALAGLRVVAAHARTLGATELRAHAAAEGRELAALGLRLALDSGRPRAALAWLERGRAVAAEARPLRPPHDPILAADLAELRRISSAVAAAIADGTDPAPLRSAQLRLEATIRRRSHRTPTSDAHARDDGSEGGLGQGAWELRLREVAVALGDRVLVEFGTLDGRLIAVVLAGGRCRQRPLGDRTQVDRACATLRFALHRLAGGHGVPAARRALGHAAAELDRLLLTPLGLDDDRELVIVPAGALHTLPWAALPTLAGRPLTVAPSAAAWLRATRASAAYGGRPLLVAGPGTAHAGDEVAALHRLYPDATVLSGREATAAAVRHALDGAGPVHIAGHGEFRAGSPLLSGVMLADGPLFGYELESLRVAPPRVVLSACDAGRAEVPGDGVPLGVAGGLLRCGVRSVIAGITPVGDAATRRLMLALHERLAAGTPPAAALAAAGAPEAALGFLCMGAS